MEFISPSAWFSISLPDGWHEFEDTEESFLFYNPERWEGNFRISAYRGDNIQYATRMLRQELKQAPQSKAQKVGIWDCVYSRIDFQEEGVDYSTHFWLTGEKDIIVECSFTIKEEVSPTIGETILKSLRIRKANEMWKRIIDIRLAEISRINMGYEWASKEVKKLLRKDFTSSEQDIEKLQALLDKQVSKEKVPQSWIDIGLTFGAILVEEMDGMRWVSIIDGKEEYPALQFEDTDVFFYPTLFIAQEKKQKGQCSLKDVFSTLKAQIEKALLT